MLENGPWFVAQRPLLLKKWMSGITFDKISSSKIPLWIILKGIPMELFTIEGINLIANGVGVPLFMDKATELRRRLSFARVCVEVDLANSLPSSVQVDIEDFGGIKVTVEYPWRPRYCSICKGLDHSDRFCPNSKEVWRPVQNKTSLPKTSNGDKSGGNVGSNPAGVSGTASYPVDATDPASSKDKSENIDMGDAQEPVEMAPPVHSTSGGAGGATPVASSSPQSKSKHGKNSSAHNHSATPPLTATTKNNNSSASKSTQAQTSN